MKSVLVFLLFLTCSSCLEKGIPVKNKIDYAGLENRVISKITPITPHFDSIRIYTGEGDALSSMIGHFFLKQDTIGFADQQLASVLLYDSTGHYLASHLKRGKGPNETLGLDKFALFLDDRFAILDGNGFLSIFFPTWEKESQNEICWYKNKSQQEIKTLKKSKDVNETAVYQFEYEGGNIKNWRNKHLIFPINLELSKCNAYYGTSADYYYGNAYTLGIVDINNGELIQMLCPRSSIYQTDQYLPNFRHVLFDVNEDTLFFSFQADSLIYKTVLPATDKIQAYGKSGNHMNTAYRTTDSYEDASENYGKDMTQYGYYTFLKYIPQTNYLFRGYRKGNASPSEGVQVYRDHCLLYDFEVPSQFEVFGYKSPYYYARIAPDMEHDEMIIYKFKL